MGELVVQQNKVPSTSRTFSKFRLIPATGSLGPDQLFALDLRPARFVAMTGR